MKAVVFYESADDLAEKAPLHAGPHRARWSELADRGELLMIGPFANALEDGAMGIFTTREAVEEFVRGDPFVLYGVVRNWTIREWNEALVPDQWHCHLASVDRARAWADGAAAQAAAGSSLWCSCALSSLP